MGTKMRKIAVVASVAGLLLSSTGVANADVVTNNLSGVTVVNVAPGGTVSVVFKVTPSNDTPLGDVNGCNVAGGKEKGTLTVSSVPVPSKTGLTIRPETKEFQNCRKNGTVDFTVHPSVANGTTYAISTAMTGGRTGALYSSTADFTLRVVAGLTSTSLAISPVTTTVAYGTSTLSLLGTLTSGTGGSAVGVAGKTINFEIDGVSVGTAETNSSGVATLAAPIGTTYPVTGLSLETTATFLGDLTHATSTASGDVTITKGTQAALAITSPTAGSFGQVLDVTSSGGSGTGTTTYGASGACSLEPGGLSVRITSGNGTCTVTGSNPGDANYNPVTATSSVFTVGKASQAALSITSPTAGTFGDLLDIVTTGGTGDGALTFSAGTNDACAIESGKLKITSGTGDCTVTATKAADANYAEAVSAPHTVTIGKAGQTITDTGPTTGTFGQDLDITHTAGPGAGAVTFTTGDSTACEVVGGKLRITSGTGTCVLTGHQAADSNYSAAKSAPLTVTTSKASATLSVGNLTPTYNGQPHAVTVTTDPADLSEVSVTYDGSATAPTRAGSYTVVASLVSANYNATPVTQTLVISPKTLTATITAASREYDGTSNAVVSPGALIGVVGNDVVTLAATNGRFDSATAGTGKQVSADISIAGADVANYVLSPTSATTTADIDPRSVTGAIVASDKTYDRTAAVSLSSVSATLNSRVLSGDVATVGVEVVSASFDSAAAGARTVRATLRLTGSGASNYALTSTTATDDAKINPVVLTGAITATNKVYDGLRTASVTPSIDGVLVGDDVTVTAVSALFSDKNADTGKAVTANLELGGLEAGNYSLAPGPYSTTADITPLDVTGAFTASDKVYDGITDASVLTRTLSTPISGDRVELSVVASFTDRHVGTAKAVTGVASLAGDDARNYRLGAVPGTTASITPKPVTGAITAANKVYDGTTTAAVRPVNPVGGVFAIDTATLTAANGQFTGDKNVGSGKPVTADIALTGAEADNYELGAATASTTANITAAPLSVTASSHALTAGAAVPTITPTYAGFVNGENSSTLTTPPTCGTAYTVGAVGTFPSACSGAVAAFGNYAPSYTNGVVSVTYAWTGFFQPIDALANHSNGKDSTVVAGTIFNKAKAGSSIPVKFSLNGDRGLAVFAADFPKVVKVDCASAGTYDDIEEISTATTSGLKYDATSDQYIYTWKTATSMAGTCQRLQVKLMDGTSHYAFFNLTK